MEYVLLLGGVSWHHLDGPELFGPGDFLRLELGPGDFLISSQDWGTS